MYCLIENESVSFALENIANWISEKPNKEVSKEEVDRLKALAEKIRECRQEFDSIVDHYWTRMAEKEAREKEECKEKEKEKEELLNLSKEELVEKLLEKNNQES